MKLTFAGFRGTASKFNEEQLADGYATVSHNTRPGRNILESWKSPALLTGGGLPTSLVKSIFPYLGKWFSWQVAGVSATKIPLTNDPYDTVMICGPGMAPALADNLTGISGAVGPYPTVTHRVGVPAPATFIPTVGTNPDWVSPTPAPTTDELDVYETSYVALYVDAWGRAGPLSPPTIGVTLSEYGTEATKMVTLTAPAVPTELIASDAVRGTTAKIRFFRGNYAAGGSGVYQFVGEAEASGGVFLDNLPAGDLADPPFSDDWIGPPDLDVAMHPNGPMRKVIDVGSSFLAGHNDRMVCFSEPGTTHAFPVSYYQVFAETLVTICSAGSDIVVLTNSTPYRLSGAHPSALSPTRLATPAPCVSERAVTEVAGMVFFATRNGMFAIDGYELVNVSSQYMTEEEWQAIGPETMIFSNYDGRVFMHAPAVAKTFVYDPGTPDDGFRTVGVNPQATAQLEDSNDLVFVPTGASAISVFDSAPSSFMAFEWRSKVYQTNDPVVLSYGKVSANSYPVTVVFNMRKLDGVNASFTKVVANDRFFPLPFSNRSRHWWCSATSTEGAVRPEIRSIQLASSPEEFD